MLIIFIFFFVFVVLTLFGGIPALLKYKKVKSAIYSQSFVESTEKYNIAIASLEIFCLFTASNRQVLIKQNGLFPKNSFMLKCLGILKTEDSEFDNLFVVSCGDTSAQNVFKNDPELRRKITDVFSKYSIYEVSLDAGVLCVKWEYPKEKIFEIKEKAAQEVKEILSHFLSELTTYKEKKDFSIVVYSFYDFLPQVLFLGIWGLSSYILCEIGPPANLPGVFSYLFQFFAFLIFVGIILFLINLFLIKKGPLRAKYYPLILSASFLGALVSSFTLPYAFSILTNLVINGSAN